MKTTTDQIINATFSAIQSQLLSMGYNQDQARTIIADMAKNSPGTFVKCSEIIYQ
jgi:Holliday junction resolvasome RuvABC DNA-binding subunit